MVKKVKDPVAVKRGRASKNKGKRGERECANMLKARGYDARRGVQFKGGLDSPDVVCEDLGFIHIEAKWVEKLNLYNAFDQAKADAGMEKVPVVIQKKSRMDCLVTMSFFDWVNLVQCALGDKDSLNTLKRVIDEQRSTNENRRRGICESLGSENQEERQSDSSLL